jgi:hypothetical protein
MLKRLLNDGERWRSNPGNGFVYTSSLRYVAQSAICDIHTLTSCFRTQDNVPAQSQWIANCPYYPQYRLSDDLELLASLDLNHIEVFNVDSQRWIGAPLNFDFTLKTDCHLFIHRLGVFQCHDFDMLLAQSKHQSYPGHLWHNMKGEWDAVRARLKTKCSVFSDESDCDSDIEIISVCKRAREDSIKISDCTPTRVRIDSSILLRFLPFFLILSAYLLVSNPFSL